MTRDGATRHAAIAAPNPMATQAGQAALAQGGNAVDAAIAAMLTATVTEPGIVAPLGGAYLNIWPADGDPVVIDGNVEMPGRGVAPARLGTGLIECVTTYGGGLTTYAGPGSVAVPGMIAGMGAAHRQFGRAPWAELFPTAVLAARDGFPLSHTAASYFELVAHTIFAWDPVTRASLTQDAKPLPAGATVHLGNLAESLEQLAAEGAQSLYRGGLAAALVADMDERGGLITAADLEAYQPVLRPGLRTGLGDWQLACNPPPSIGGPVLTALLRVIAAEYDLKGELRADQAARVMRAVLDHRLQRVDVADDLEAAGQELLATIEALGDAGLSSPPDTAHVSVVDSDGTACAITASAGYGSGMTIAGTGLLGNNALGEPELNRRGMHALPPGTRLASNMAPTTGRHPDGSRLAIGSPGADRITTALMQVLVHFCLHGEDLQHAVNAPRMHVRHLDDGSVRIDHERDDHLATALAAQSLPRHVHEPLAMFFGGVGAALRSADGTLSAAADPRRASATAVG